eukprot:COSAG02_NODE_6963_length_3260_cov_3.294843_3_plen_123_part_00
MQNILACFLYHSTSAGVNALHGGHQDAEKYRPMNRLPASAVLVSIVVDLCKTVEPISEQSVLLAFAGPTTIAVAGAPAAITGVVPAAGVTSGPVHPSSCNAATNRERSSSSLKENLSSPASS